MEIIDVRTIRREMRHPAARPFLMAFMDLMNGRLKMIEAYREAGFRSMTILDGVVLFQILAFAAIGGDGTRQADLINSISAPRATIRNCLRRLEAAGIITRGADGRYHARQIVADTVNAAFEDNFRQAARFADAFIEWRTAIGRQ
jgi:hypothetical protein